MITRAINLLGVYLGQPRDLLSPAQSNPEGFWEHKGVVEINKKILKKLSTSWDTTQPLPKRCWDNRDIRPLRIQLAHLVRRKLAIKPLWGWKDPRTCLLLPLWKAVLADQNVDLSYIIIVRNPLDVAASLWRRNKFPIKKSLDIWTLYTLSSLVRTEGKPRVVVHYDRFLENWETELRNVTDALHIRWPHREEHLRRTMNNFLQPCLRHSKTSIDRLEKGKNVPNLVVKTYRLCLEVEQSAATLDSKDFSHDVSKLYSRIKK